MRFGGAELDATEQAQVASTLVEKLRSEDASEVAASAEELFRMTSFKSAVAIDTPEAMTDYDRSVFGAGAGAGDAVTPPAGNSTADVSFSTGDAHVDGRRYLMGDGFMLDEDFADGSVRTRRVAVMHSRSCLDNRTIIGNVPGVFEALVTAIRSHSAESRYQACRAASQIIFRNKDNKTALGNTPDAMAAIGHVVMLATQDMDKRTLAQACRVLGVLVAGDEKNSMMAAQDAPLVANLRACLLDGEDEVSGQAGKVLNSISYLIPEDTDAAK